MARCGNCGTVNREGSVFCQSCGQKMEEQKAKPASGPTCGSCGTQNALGMNFCKMCGSSLAAAAPAAAPAAEAGAARIICASCGKQTPSGFAFCQHCGQRLATTPQGAAPAPVVAQGGDKRGVAATMMAEAPPLATPPAGMPKPVTAPATTQRPTSGASSEAFAATVGPGVVAPMLDGARQTGAPMSTVRTSPVRPDSAVLEKIYATLVVVRRDGTDGETVRVTAPVFDIGRIEGGLTFADDGYLAARHLRFSFENASPVVRALDGVNGVYVRLRAAVDLHPNDVFLVGKEVVRFEAIGVEERDVAAAEHGVRLFGTAPRENWGRLRQLTAAGTTRDVWHIARPDLVLGREEGDVTFPDDEFMSRRHAAVRRGSPRAKLEDLSSSNGTFIRVRGDHVLRSGDLLRFGDQLLRVEL